MMCSEFKLLDTVSLHNVVNINNAIIASEDNRYCILVEDGLYILHLCGLMDNISLTTSLKKLFIKLPEFTPSEHFEINLDSFLTKLPQHELYEAILRLNVSENLQSTVHLTPQVVQAKWSPMGLIENNHCTLAVLTNTGFLSIFVHTVNEVELEQYIPIANITKNCIDHFKQTWNNINSTSPSNQFKELKRRVDEALPSAFTWTDLLTCNNERFCILIVGHLNGGISLWKISGKSCNDVTEFRDIELVLYKKLNLSQIVLLHWHQANNNGLLLVSDSEGKTTIISIKNISTENVTFDLDVCLWKECDNLRVEHIRLYVYNGMIYIIMAKGSFLLVYLIGESGKMIDHHNVHVGDFRIAGLEHYQDNVFILITCTGVTKEFKLMCENDRIRIGWRSLYIDYKWSSYETYGIIVSPNRVFFAILVGVLNLDAVRRAKSHTKLLLYMNKAKNPLDILMNNSAGCLTSHWDCLETIRIYGLLEKELPSKGLPTNLNYDSLSLVQLKTCLWLIRSSESMQNKMSTVTKVKTLSYDELKYIVRIKLAIEHMSYLLDLLAKNKKLDDFHMQSLDVLNMFLKQIVADDIIPRIKLGTHTIENVYNVIKIANKLRYPPLPVCKWCNENITGLTCKSSHADNRCNISLMPVIDLPYYKCPFCECVVHHKMKEISDTVMCPYCDIALDLVGPLNGYGLIEDSRQSNDEDVKEISVQEEVISKAEDNEDNFIE